MSICEGIKAGGWLAQWKRDHKVEGLLEFMRKERNADAHRQTSRRKVGQEDIKLNPGATYSDASGTAQVFGVPPVLVGGANMPTAVIHKPIYSYTIDGVDRPVREVCKEYLSLLRQMVTDYEADHK